MTRTEIIEELNKKRKGDEIRARQKFIAIDAKKTTAQRLQELNTEIERIRDEYAKALLKLDRETSAQKFPGNTPEEKPQETNSPEASNLLQKQAPNDDILKRADNILKGAENLPENDANLGQNTQKKNVDGIQSREDSQNMPQIVRGAREQNRSEQIQEAQYEERTADQAGNQFGQNQNTESRRAEAIRNEFQASGVNLSDVTDSNNDADLLSEIKEAKKTSSLDFPILILFVAVLKDCSDILSAFLETIPVLGIMAWFVATGFSLVCSGVIWFWMLGKGSKMQRKIIIKFVAEKLPLMMVGIFAELLPILSLMPTTTITVFFIAQTSTKLGQTIHKASEKAEMLKM